MNSPVTNAPVIAPPAAAAAQRMILLVGNPNVGKSVLFSKLTGRFVIISNYPGTTVELTRGEAVVHGEACAVLDTPGVNELAPRTEDARVTCDVLRDHPEAVIVQVADAKNLRRALLLTLQLSALRRPMVLVLNMMDELASRGGEIEMGKLSELLGMPVVPTVATEGQGIEAVKEAVCSRALQRGLEDRHLVHDRAEALYYEHQPRR
jgi:ferrous iron transport protein B